MKKLLSILLFSMLLFTTCKKYPEGGLLRQGPKVFTTIKNEMWKLTLYEVNCIDGTFLIKTPLIKKILAKK